MKTALHLPAFHAANIANAAHTVWTRFSGGFDSYRGDLRHWVTAPFGNPFAADDAANGDVEYVRGLADGIARSHRGLADDLYAAADRAEYAKLGVAAHR